jgi:hypothetical protein
VESSMEEIEEESTYHSRGTGTQKRTGAGNSRNEQMQKTEIIFVFVILKIWF